MLRSAARRDAVAQLLVLVEQRLEVSDLFLERDLLAPDRVAALTHDAEEEQIHEGDAARDGQPRLQLRALHLLVDLVGQLVELGRADDPVDALARSAAAHGDVHLDQVVEAARALLDVLFVLEIAHIRDDRSAERLLRGPRRRGTVADQRSCRCCTTTTPSGRQILSATIFSPNAVSLEQRIEAGDVGLGQPLARVDALQVRLDEALDV